MSDFPRIILGVSSTQIYKNTDDNNLNFYNNNMNVISLDSSGNVGIGDITPEYKLDVNGTGRFTSDLTVDANLIVHGTTVTMNTSTIQVEDPLISLGSNNTSDGIDLGFYSKYNDGTDKWTGLFRDSTDGEYKLFKELQVQPTTTVNTSGTGYSLANFECASINLTGSLTVDTNALVVNSSNVGIGTNSASAKLHVSGTTEEGLRIDLNHGSLTSNGIYFYNNGLSRFIVEGDGDCLNRNNTYTNISDGRLKKNIVEANTQWEDLKNIKFYNYNFVNEDRTKHIGVIAQQMEEVSPGLVKTSNSNEYVNGVLVKNIKTVKSSVLYMKGMKTLQEAQIRIEKLENDKHKIKDLEYNIKNIEENGLKEITFDRIKIEELENNMKNIEENNSKEIKELENNITEILKDLDTVVENNMKNIEENNSKEIKELENIKENNSKEIQELENNMENNMKNIEENNSKEIQELENNMKNIEENGLIKIKELENNMKNIEENNSKEIKELENNMENIKENNSKEIKELENNMKNIEENNSKEKIFINNKQKVINESTFLKIAGTSKPMDIIDNMAYIQYMDKNNNIKQYSEETTPLYYGIDKDSLNEHFNIYDKETNSFLPTIYKNGKLINDEIEIYNHSLNENDIVLVQFTIDNVKHQEEILVTKVLDTTHIKIDNTKLLKYFSSINNRDIFVYGVQEKDITILNEKFLYSLSSLSLSGIKELNNKVNDNFGNHLELINVEQEENNKQNVQIKLNSSNVTNISTKFNTLVQEHMALKNLVTKSAETINKLLNENNNLKNTVGQLNDNFNKQNQVNLSNFKIVSENIQKQQMIINQLLKKINNQPIV